MAGHFLAGNAISEGAFYSVPMAQTIKAWQGRVHFEGTYASCSSLAAYVRALNTEPQSTVVDLVDVDSQKWFDYATRAAVPRRWLYSIEAQRVRRLECSLAQRGYALAVVSELERSCFREFCKDGSVSVIPNGVDLEYFLPQPDCPKPHCVFVGALDYWPNVQGITWFCQEVWPLIHGQLPASQLSIVGRRPVRKVQRLSAIAGVQVIGQVPDVRPYVLDSGVVIAPLLIARGIQNKVLEAMAMAKPVVASSAALQGIPATPGVDLLQANSPVEWAAHLTRLFSSRAERTRLGTAGRAYVEQHHDWNECLQPFARLLFPEPSAAPLYSN
jgi:sugar transferase (PEP-CTERM/EpsH1 system associated)